MSPSTTVTTARDAASVGTVEPTIWVRAMRTFASSPPRRRRERVHRDAGGVRARDRAHGDPPLRVRRDKHSSPCERPERERSELEDGAARRKRPSSPPKRSDADSKTSASDPATFIRGCPRSPETPSARECRRRRGRSVSCNSLTSGALLSARDADPAVDAACRPHDPSARPPRRARGRPASQLIARDAKDVTLRVNARGQALVGYRAKGKQWTVLAWAR